jgi:hypothetical protein
VAIDSPDYSDTPASPAILLGTFNQAANTTVTYGPYTTPPGTHAIKVYIGKGSLGQVGTQVVVQDATLGNDVLGVPAPTDCNIFAVLDDITVPSFTVTLTTTTGSGGWQGSIVAFLSDQAVTVDNDANSPLPVDLPNEVISVPVDGDLLPGILVAAGPSGTAQSVAINSVITSGSSLVLVPAVGGVNLYPVSLTVGALPPASTTLLSFEDTSGGVKAGMLFTSTAPQVPWFFDFGGGVGGTVGLGLRLRNTGSGSIQVAGMLVWQSGSA